MILFCEERYYVMDFYKGILIGISIGILGVMFFIPIIQQLQSVIVNALEVINGYTTKNVAQRNAEIQYIQAKLEDDLQPVGTSAVGFEVPDAEYVYGDECQKETIADRRPVGFN